MGVVITSARQAHRRWDFCFCSLVAAVVLARVQLLDIVLFFDIVLLAFTCCCFVVIFRAVRLI